MERRLMHGGSAFGSDYHFWRRWSARVGFLETRVTVSINALPRDVLVAIENRVVT